MKIFAIIFLCINFLSLIFCARILGILHVPTSSHNKIGVTLLKGLADRGHNVTILSALDPKLNHSNVRYIFLDLILELYSKHRFSFQPKWIKNSLTYYINFNMLTNDFAEGTLESNAMKNLLKSEEKFDVIFIEPFLNHAFLGLGEHFNAQIIVLSTSNNFLANLIYGYDITYSFVPNVQSSYTDKMIFRERLYNTFLNICCHIMNYIYNKPVQENLYKTYFPNATLSLDEAIRNVSLHLVNSHVIYETPRPYLPNMIPIGGLHIKPPKKLPKDIQEYLDNAKDGAIYFSLGSYIQSTDLKEAQKNAILGAFSKIPQKVLWKFEGDLPNKPKNILISKWFPQNDILAHPNIKLFITHGGLLSTVETIYRGVPILGIPFIFDQHNNVAQFVASGWGESILFPDITEDTFIMKIQQILNNASYHENIRKASKILQDQLETPLERGIYWTEHILKYGSKHLHPASLDLSITEYLLLDVLAFVVLNVLFVCLLIYYMINNVFRNITNQKHYKRE